jgi:arylsulfatase A
LNGSKTHVYEGGIRLPLLMRWPDKIEAGTTNETFVHFLDWLPTLAAACNVQIPDSLALDGQDIFSDILQPGKPDVRRRTYWQWNRFTPFVTCNAAMRDGAWKLVQPAIIAYMPPCDPQDIIQMDVEMKYQPEKFSDMPFAPVPKRDEPSPRPPELFNLANDPLEQHNLADVYPKRTASMLNDLETWFEEVEAERLSRRD